MQTVAKYRRASSTDTQGNEFSISVRKRAIIYCRVSTDKQEQDGESLDYQEEKGRQYAELHDMDVVLVLQESKSGFIHYSLREKLTLARQMVRDHLADVIIVFDLRRFSRNFVHSAMIFEEIESAGGEIVSVSENIDNSLTGKLIRSILAWSAESEREKIVEYANRHWQTRLAHDLPLATGRAPYGWAWSDKEKTAYVINQEEAAVRLGIFQMFVELDMSLRSIAHTLTEDGILPPAKARGWKAKTTVWQPSTVHKLLSDTENIGILRICKSTVATTVRGTPTRKRNSNMKMVPGGIPALTTIELYERAQRKLKGNRADKSHRHRNPEDFLLKGRVSCNICGYRMSGSYKVYEHDRLAYYRCGKANNKYYACPELTEMLASKLDAYVWADCCRVFERLDLIRETIEQSVEQSLQSMLEDTQGNQLITQLEQELAFTRIERAKHPEGGYYYNLISQDIRDKEERLRRYTEEYANSLDVSSLVGHYRSSILNFLNFLNVMKGRYAEATFQEKRNALEVLGVTVSVKPTRQNTPPLTHLETGKEWLSLTEAATLAGVSEKVIWHRARKGEFATCKREESRRCTFVHRDEFNRFLSTLTIRPRGAREDFTSRVEVTYSPMFAGVQSSLT